MTLESSAIVKIGIFDELESLATQYQGRIVKGAVKKIIPTSWWSNLCKTKLWWSRLRWRNHCPVVLPWFKVTNDSCDLAHIHRLGLNWGRPETRKDVLIYSTLWPILSAVKAANIARRYGKCTRRNYGVSMFSQWIQMVRFANFYNIEPESYYKFRLWETENQKRADRYLQDHEIIALLWWLKRRINTDRVDNKALFFEACQQLNIPTASTIAVFNRKNNERWYTEPGCVPNSDIFVKLTDRWCGIGCEAWDYDHERHSWTWDGTTLNERQLLERWREQAKHEELIIQPSLKNHPDVGMFSTRALCTLRVVTYFTTEMSKPKVLCSSWRMPVGAAHIDNFSAGGIAAGVFEDGRLGHAVGMNDFAETITLHPTTNAPILNEQLPSWREMVELALSAHEKFCMPCSIGWDIALVDEGPIVLEGNSTWCGDVMQMLLNRPFGETKFVDIFDSVLAELDLSCGLLDAT